LFGQTDSIHVNVINRYISRTDSLIDDPNFSNGIYNFLEEGEISREIMTIRKVGHTNKVDTLRNKITGGWSKSNYHKGDTLFKVEYHDNLQKNLYLTFYYMSNKLVYGKLEYQEDGIGQTFYEREEFYGDSSLLLVNETKMDLKDDYKKRAAYSLRKRGQEYFEDFKKQN
jgi:hypothetical protein